MFYVDSRLGRDTNRGISPLAPFASLTRAQQAARSAPKPATVEVHGTFTLTAPLSFGPADSGVSWEATDPGRPPMITGARVIAPTGRNHWTYNAALRVWSLTGVTKLSTRDLWVNGHRADRVHSCVGNEPCGAHNTFVPSTLSLTNNGKSTTPDVSLPAYSESLGGRLHTYRNQSSIELVYRFDGSANSAAPWAEPRCGVASIIVTNITMDRCFLVGRELTPFPIGIPAEVENASELFDPVALGNQWYWDPVSSTLSYQPSAADPPGPPRAIVAGGLDGVLASINGAHDLHFSHLTFGYTTWTDPSGPQGMIDEQTGIAVTGCGTGCLTRVLPPAAVSAVHASGLTFDRDGFVHLGAGGVSLGPGVSRSSVTRSFFQDIGGTGVSVGTVDPSVVAVDDTVAGNVFTGVIGATGYAAGAAYHSSPAIWAGYARALHVTDNRICAFGECTLPNEGIAVGWGWNTPAPGVGDNTIAGNRVTNTMQWLWDGAPIYSLGVQPGEMIRANVVSGAHQAPAGIYVDQGGTDVTVLDNVVSDVRYLRDPFASQQDRPAAAVFLHTCATGPVRVLNTFGDSSPWVTVDTSAGGCTGSAAVEVRGSFLGLPATALPASIVNPGAPAGLMTAPSAVVAKVAGPLLQRVSWTPSNGSTGYEVQQNDPRYGTVVVAASATSPAVASSPTAQQSYTSVVLARDADGDLSPPSAPATALP